MSRIRTLLVCLWIALSVPPGHGFLATSRQHDGSPSQTQRRRRKEWHRDSLPVDCSSPWRRQRQRQSKFSSTTTEIDASESGQRDDSASRRPPCYYRSPRTQKWTSRIELEDLVAGQELPDAHVVQEYLTAKTGPKLFVDCGVGRYRHKNNSWSLQTAMLRLPLARKRSVTTKRAARLRKKKYFTVYVDRVFPDSDQLEVRLKQEKPTATTKTTQQQQPQLRPVSSLTVGQECVGTIVEVRDYGVLVRLDGINRPGLLHIQQVADLYGHYIHKAAGLVKAGLEQGARIKCQVLSVSSRKRLLLDFTTAAQQEAARQRAETRAVDQEPSAVDNDISAQTEQAPAWTAHEEVTEAHDEDDPYAAYYNSSSDDNEEYDEDREIEDQFGLGTY